MKPKAWLVKWALMGKPNRVPLEMLLDVPEEAFVHSIGKEPRNIATGQRVKIGGFLASVGEVAYMLFWNKEEKQYRGSVVGKGPEVVKSEKYDSLEGLHEWLRQQI